MRLPPRRVTVTVCVLTHLPPPPRLLQISVLLSGTACLQLGRNFLGCRFLGMSLSSLVLQDCICWRGRRGGQLWPPSRGLWRPRKPTWQTLSGSASVVCVSSLPGAGSGSHAALVNLLSIYFLCARHTLTCFWAVTLVSERNLLVTFEVLSYKARATLLCSHRGQSFFFFLNVFLTHCPEKIEINDLWRLHKKYFSADGGEASSTFSVSSRVIQAKNLMFERGT